MYKYTTSVLYCFTALTFCSAPFPILLPREFIIFDKYHYMPVNVNLGRGRVVNILLPIFNTY